MAGPPRLDDWSSEEVLQATLTIQKAARRFILVKRLRNLASFRTRLGGVVLGYRARKVLRQPAIKAQIKEI